MLEKLSHARPEQKRAFQDNRKIAGEGVRASSRSRLVIQAMVAMHANYDHGGVLPWDPKVDIGRRA